jgi:hypothetical protein
MMMTPKKELDFNGVKRYSVKQRPSKVNGEHFARPLSSKGDFHDFWEALPDILQVSKLKSLVRNLRESRDRGAPIYWMMGGHVIKVGLGPLIKQLIDEGWVQGLFMNSAASIHDSEIARFGATSEDVSIAIRDGSFGMAEETSVEYLHELKVGVDSGLGWGESVATWLGREEHPYREKSLLAHCFDRDLLVTIHGALGTDIIWQHPEMDGACLGLGGERDFKKMAYALQDLEGGAVLNWGSAVIMPEVFLKAFTVARNLGAKMEIFSTANFDMIQHYRPRVNVLERPTQGGGASFAMTGHHEIMMPLVAQALICGV